MYQVECPYCPAIHAAECWDELTDQVDQCRQRAGRAKLGLLEDFDRETCPVAETWCEQVAVPC